MVLLVTGCAGFIGTNFVDYYLSKHPDTHICGFDKLTYASNINNLIPVRRKGKLKFIHGDIANVGHVNDLLERFDISSIINFAAETHIDNSIKNPEVFFRSNAYGTYNLLECIRKRGENVRFIQVSTDEVYGSLGETGKPFTENSPLHPNNPYSASKATGDFYIIAYHNTYGLPGIITRSTNNFGPYQHREKLIPMVIRNALEHKTIPVYGDGLQVRDWIYVKDHCGAIDFILRNGKPGEVYNIGACNPRTNLSVILLILGTLQEITGDNQINSDLIRYVPDRAGHDRRYGLDTTKLRDLGWEPESGFTAALEQTIRWYANEK